MSGSVMIASAQPRSTLSALGLLSLMVACSSNPPTSQGPKPVEVVIHTMSACPFGGELVKGLVPLVASLDGAVRLVPKFIGRDESGTLASIYGPKGVRGDLIQTCAWSEGGFAAWSKVSLCHAGQPAAFDPDSCLPKSQVEREPIERCLQSSQGNALLRASYAGSRSADVQASPTLVVDGTPYRGGRTEAHLAELLCSHSRLRGTAYCHQRTRPSPVEVVIWKARGCRADQCDSEPIEASLKLLLPRVSLRHIVIEDVAESARPEGLSPDTTLAAFVSAEDARPYKASFDRLSSVFRPLPSGAGYLARFTSESATNALPSRSQVVATGS